MATSLQPRQYGNDDEYSSGSSSPRTTIIIVVAILVVLKITIIIGLCYWRSKKRAERRAKGCHCYEDTDYYCLPWWYWSSDSRCHCAQIGAPAPWTTNTAYQPAPPYGEPPASQVAQPDEARDGYYAYGSEPMEMKPTYAPAHIDDQRGRALSNEGLSAPRDEARDASNQRLLGGGRKEPTPEVRVLYG